MSDRWDFLELGDKKPASEAVPSPDLPALESERPRTSTELKAVELIGEPGTAAGQFNAPAGLAVDIWGSLYIADSNNHRVQRITQGGDVYVYGKPGTGIGELWGPQGVAVSADGKFFYAVETGSSRIQKFLFTSQPQGSVVGFINPRGAAFDPQGRLWIADTGNGRILRLDIPTGKFTAGLDSGVGLRRPTSIACDSRGLIYVTDSGRSDVLIFDARGVLIRSLGDRRPLKEPGQVAVDSQQRIYLAETGANRLLVLNSEGDSLAVLETNAVRPGPLSGPVGVAVSERGEIYLSDTGNNRVFRIAWV